MRHVVPPSVLSLIERDVVPVISRGFDTGLSPPKVNINIELGTTTTLNSLEQSP